MSLPAPVARLHQDEVEQALLSPPGGQACAKFREHGVVEAGIGQLPAEGIFPIQPTAHRIRCLPVGQALYELQHRHQCSVPWCLGGVPTSGETRRRVVQRKAQGRRPIVRGALLLVEVARLPQQTRQPQALWLWWHTPADPDSIPELDRAWRAYVRRFDLEHTFR